MSTVKWLALLVAISIGSPVIDWIVNAVWSTPASTTRFGVSLALQVVYVLVLLYIGIRSAWNEIRRTSRRMNLIVVTSAVLVMALFGLVAIVLVALSRLMK